MTNPAPGYGRSSMHQEGLNSIYMEQHPLGEWVYITVENNAAEQIDYAEFTPDQGDEMAAFIDQYLQTDYLPEDIEEEYPPPAITTTEARDQGWLSLLSLDGDAGNDENDEGGALAWAEHVALMEQLYGEGIMD